MAKAPTLILLSFGASLLLPPRASRGQVELGLVGGVAPAGRQDVTVEQRDAQGTVISAIQEPGLRVASGPAWGISMFRWSARHPAFGLSLDALYWRSSMTVANVNTPPARSTVHQERTGLFGSLAGRVPLARGAGATLYGTIGMGVVDSSHIGGSQRVGFGLSVTAGGSVPIVEESLRARLEIRYLITRDFDSVDSSNQNLEFSGSPSTWTARRVFGGHQDTRFFPLLFGLSWRL